MNYYSSNQTWKIIDLNKQNKEKNKNMIKYLRKNYNRQIENGRKSFERNNKNGLNTQNRKMID